MQGCARPRHQPTRAADRPRGGHHQARSHTRAAAQSAGAARYLSGARGVWPSCPTGARLHVRMNGGWIHCLRGSNVLARESERRRSAAHVQCCSVAHMGMCCYSPNWLRTITHVVTRPRRWRCLTLHTIRACRPRHTCTACRTSCTRSMPSGGALQRAPCAHSLRHCLLGGYSAFAVDTFRT